MFLQIAILVGFAASLFLFAAVIIQGLAVSSPVQKEEPSSNGGGNGGGIAKILNAIAKVLAIASVILLIISSLSQVWGVVKNMF